MQQVQRILVMLFCVGISTFITVGDARSQVRQFPQGEFPLTDYKQSSVAMGEILSGGPPRDGIPAIDDPKYSSVGAAREWLRGQEPVIAVQQGDKARAYPLQILMYHEIVNDMFGKEALAVTFCPLCNASIVFKRTVPTPDDSRTAIDMAVSSSERVLDFGTTGRLRNSDLIMYDRQTESWWQQFTGVGIIGEYTGVALERVNSQIISFQAFADAFPEGEVLSRDTGYARPYGNNPYRGYDAIDNNPFLYDGVIDPRLPAMERVLSLGEKGKTHLVPLSKLIDSPILNLTINSTPVVVLAATAAASALDDSTIADSRQVPSAAAFDARLNDRTLTFLLQDGHVVDSQTRSRWNPFGRSISGELKGMQLSQVDQGVHFAFAWLAFDPDARIVTSETMR
ncbi:MAG: DUF3179 domain-containing protein [Granulosicoccus sp.]|nr:DUF3179 domain-containing protein [Granulosicoccus sp.]